MTAMTRSEFLSMLRKFFDEIENQAIENKVYFDLLLERNCVSRSELEKLTSDAQKDSKKREEVHQQFAEMWTEFERIWTSVFEDEQLNRTPPPGKPN